MLKEVIYEILKDDITDKTESETLTEVNEQRLKNSDMTVSSVTGLEHIRYSLKTLMGGSGTNWAESKIFFDRSAIERNIQAKRASLPVLGFSEKTVKRRQNGSGKDWGSIVSFDIYNMTEVQTVYKDTQAIVWRIVYLFETLLDGKINPYCETLTKNGLEIINRAYITEVEFSSFDLAQVNAEVLYTII